MDPGDGIWDPALGAWRPVALGEAVLGHVDESGAVAGAPVAAPLEHNASYLVVRRLEQDVDGFWRSCAAWADELGEPWRPEDVAAQLVGRHRDGTPLGRPPGGPGAGPAGDVLYRDPRFGPVAIPPSAHIRRANPRDALAFAPQVVGRHVLFRRGLPYAEPATDARPHGRQGLVFVAGCADLQRQFEFVQARWLQDGDRFGLGAETDPLTGQRGDAAPVSIAGTGGERCRRALPTFVTTRGGAYLLLPAPSVLRRLGGDGPRP